MPNKKYRYHPYLSSEYLTRNNCNYCLNCGEKMGNIKPTLDKNNQLWFIPFDCPKPVLLGYCHIQCKKGNGGDKNVKARPG